jgi:hypothetical protein
LDRILTAFVSSTYLDLVSLRGDVQQYCLNVGIMPLGMEYFPATGANQWELITECIHDADICVFILAGSYGSIDPHEGISWTHKEFRYAVEMKKPTVVLLRSNLKSLPVHDSETDPVRIAQLAEFHREVRGQECALWENDKELQKGLSRSIDYLKRKEGITGWVRADKAVPPSDDETQYDRVYEYVESYSRYCVSTTDPRCLDMEHEGHRIVRCNTTGGLSTVALIWTKNTDRHAAFDPANPPQVELVSSKRSAPGSVSLEEPRKLSGSSFVVDVKFDPALRLGEEVEFKVRGSFPNYRYSNAEDTKQATKGTPIGERSFDYMAWTVSYPLRKFVMKVDLPVGVGIEPLGPRSGQAAYLPPTAGPDPNMNEEYFYSQVGSEAGSVARMQLTVLDAKLKHVYRLAWQLP